MEWLYKSEINQYKQHQRKEYFSKIKLSKVDMLSNDDYVHKLATKVYYELTKIKTQNQIQFWINEMCGISTTYIKNMTKLERVLLINIYLTTPPVKGKEIYM